MDPALFGSELWKPALDKYAEATGLSVGLFDADGRVVLDAVHSTPLGVLFREHGFDPGLFSDCARRCIVQSSSRPVMALAEPQGLAVVGAPLVSEGAIVGAAVAGYVLTGFPNMSALQRWAKSAGLPFERLWDVVRGLSPVSERRLRLSGELLQVLGDTLLRENRRTRQYEDAALKLQAAAASKDHEFLAILSHELRNSIAPIAGWASVLRNNQGAEEVRRAAEAIERNALLQGRLVEDLVDVHRIVHGTMRLELEVLDLRTCIRAAQELIAEAARKNDVAIEMDGTAQPLFILADAGRLQQVFGNILGNALKFTPPGGRIRVTLGREAGRARVVIADTGKGIAPEFLPFVFDLFRQEQDTRREHEGLGIGLAVVKKLCALHQGTIGVASPGPGRGTEVTVRFPLAAAPSRGDGAGAERAARTPAFAGICVLVVDDVEDARESLRLILQSCGARVSVAGDGGEALAAVDQTQPDVVLCDLRMPGIDGFEFMRELRRRTAHPPVVAMSGLAGDADRRRTLDAGFEAHLVKPFGEAGLVAAVDEALGRRTEHRSGASPR